MHTKKIIDKFKPSIERITPENIGFFSEFNISTKGFDDYISNYALEDKFNGDGVTYVVLDNNTIVSFYTLCVTSILYNDRYHVEDTDTYDTKLCGIPSVEIKMFAVNDEYQDCFYKDSIDEPISALILKDIINYIDELSKDSIGIKAVFLHSTEEGKPFYIKNNFKPLEEYMECVYSIDDDCEPFYFPIREFNIHYDE